MDTNRNLLLNDMSAQDIQRPFNLITMQPNQILNISTDIFIDDTVEDYESDSLMQNDFGTIQFCDICNIVYYFNNFDKHQPHCNHETNVGFSDMDFDKLEEDASSGIVSDNSYLTDDHLSSGPSSLSSFITTDTEDLHRNQPDGKKRLIEGNKYTGSKKIKCETILSCCTTGKWYERKKFFGFQFKNFCTINCLKQHSNIPSHCSFCHHDVNWKLSSYSFTRYDENLKYDQMLIFCDNICYQNHLDKYNLCYFCLKFIAKDNECLRVKNTQIYFCTLNCLNQYSVLEVKAEDQKTSCHNCQKDLIGKSLPITLEDKDENIFCSFMCRLSYFAKIKFQNCFMCDKEKADCRFNLFCFNLKCYFCSKACRNQFCIRHRVCEKCNNCGINKIHSDMIELKSINTVHNYYCCVNCLIEDNPHEITEFTDTLNDDLYFQTSVLLMNSINTNLKGSSLDLFKNNDKFTKKCIGVNTCGERIDCAIQVGGIVNNVDCSTQTDLPHIYPLCIPLPVIFPFQYSLRLPLIFCTINFEVLNKMFPFVIPEESPESNIEEITD